MNVVTEKSAESAEVEALDEAKQFSEKPSKLGFSFKVSGGIQKQQDRQKIAEQLRVEKVFEDGREAINTKEAVVDLEESLKKKRKQPTIVIPLIRNNQWRKKNEKKSEERATKKRKIAAIIDNPHATAADREAARELLRKIQNEEKEDDDTSGIEAIPLLMKNAVPGVNREMTDDEKFRTDVAIRPDVATLEEYDKVPVDAFGIAMLKGMGWKKGGKIGLTNAQCVKARQFVPRGHRLGLGATAKAEEAPSVGKNGKKRPRKPGDPKEAKQVMRVKPNADGRVSHTVDLDQELVPVHTTTLKEGSLVHITRGSHQDLYGRVLEVGTKKCTVQLNLSGEEVRVKQSRLDVLDEHMLPKNHAALSQPSHTPSSSRSHRSRSHTKPLRWVRASIRVRVISNRMSGGRYYNKKGRVSDVISPTEFEVIMDDSGDRLTACEEDVETALPKAGGMAMIIQGDGKGRWGTLLERSSKRNSAIIQDHEEPSMVTTHVLDDVAEYIV